MHGVARWLLIVCFVWQLTTAVEAQPRIRRQPVESTSLASVGYSKKWAILEVQFRSGQIYRFHDVPVEVYRDLLNAQSKGRFLHREIRSRFASTAMTGRRKPVPTQ